MTSKKNFQSITLYKDMAPQVLELTKEEAGDIYQAIFRFSCYGEDTDFSKSDRFVRSLWETTKLKLQAGEEHDSHISKTNSENAKARWEKKKGSATECDRNQSSATECDRTTYTNTETGTNSFTPTISSTVTKQEQTDADSDSVDRQAASAAAEAEPPHGDLFSVKQLIAIVQKNKVDLTEEGIKEFNNQMREDGWTLYGKSVEKKTILRTLREYAKRHPEYVLELKAALLEQPTKKFDAERLVEEQRKREKEEKKKKDKEEAERLMNDPVAMEQWLKENGMWKEDD